jgi:hypothetical protein
MLRMAGTCPTVCVRGPGSTRLSILTAGYVKLAIELGVARDRINTIIETLCDRLSRSADEYCAGVRERVRNDEGKTMSNFGRRLICAAVGRFHTC